MTPDPLDQLSARLFEAARNEAIPQGAEQRALEAARLQRAFETRGNARFSVRQKWLAGVACAAMAAGSALLLRPKEVPMAINAEPQLGHSRPERQTVPRVEAPSEAAPAVRELRIAPKPAPNAGRPLLNSAPVSLSDELSALKVASSALSAGDTQAALAALDRYDRVLKGQKMRAEATLLRIEALSRAGQAATASALARRFVEQNPASPLVDRARSFVHE